MTSELTACAAVGLLCFTNLRLPFSYFATQAMYRHCRHIQAVCMHYWSTSAQHGPCCFLGSSLQRCPRFHLSNPCLSIRIRRALLRSRVCKRAHHVQGNEMENERVRKKSGGRRSGWRGDAGSCLPPVYSWQDAGWRLQTRRSSPIPTCGGSRRLRITPPLLLC